MAHRLPHDPKNLRHVQITMAHRPSRTGFWIGLLFFPRDLVHFTSVREFFDLTPNVKERMAHLQIVFYQPKFSDVIPIVGTTYLISKNVIHDGFPHWHTEYIQVLRYQFSFLQPITLPIHVCAHCFHEVPMRTATLCTFFYLSISVLNLTQSVVNRMAHHQLDLYKRPGVLHVILIALSLRDPYEVFTRSVRDLDFARQGSRARQQGSFLLFPSLL